jgi:hypothetical protein
MNELGPNNVSAGNASVAAEFPSRPGSPSEDSIGSIKRTPIGEWNFVRPFTSNGHRVKADILRPTSPERVAIPAEFAMKPYELERLNKEPNMPPRYSVSYGPTKIRGITRKQGERRLTIGGTRKASAKSGFTFYSVQEHSNYFNGKGKTVRKEVNIKNGKGTKTVVMHNEKGKTRRSTVKIGENELEKIRRNIFVPGLFRECIDNCNAKNKSRS